MDARATPGAMMLGPLVRAVGALVRKSRVAPLLGRSAAAGLLRTELAVEAIEALPPADDRGPNITKRDAARNAARAIGWIEFRCYPTDMDTNACDQL